MAFTPEATRATKHQVKLKIGIQGPSGSGKTLGALELAKGFVPGGKVLLVDTEHESASLYADKYEFDTIPLPPPFLSANYEACIDYAVKNGYDVLIIDSITHQWDGDGGILRRKEAIDERGGNSFTNWKPFTEEHNRFKEKIIQAPIHIIATMRSKTEYILEANDKGKSMPKKVGTAPIQRDGMEYEFSLVFDVQMDHRGKASKNRTGLFEGELVNLCAPATAEALRNWMSSGAAPEPSLQPAPSAKSPVPATKDVSPDFLFENGVMDCQVLDVRPRPAANNKKAMIAVKVNAPAGQKDMLFCFHESLFHALASIQKHERAIFSIKQSGDFLNIEDVRFVGTLAYQDGKPVQQPKALEITDDDLPTFGEAVAMGQPTRLPGIDDPF